MRLNNLVTTFMVSTLSLSAGTFELKKLDLSIDKVSCEQASDLFELIESRVDHIASEKSLSIVEKSALTITEIKSLYAVLCKMQPPKVDLSSNKKKDYKRLKKFVRGIRREFVIALEFYKDHYLAAIESIKDILNDSKLFEESKLDDVTLFEYCSCWKEKKLQYAMDEFFKQTYENFGFKTPRKFKISYWFGKLRKELKKTTNYRYTV